MNVENISDIPIEQLYSHPVIQELLDKLENQDLERSVKLPYVIKNKILMSPGVWNGYFYSSDSIKDAFLKTAWDKKENRSLFLDHLDGTNGRMGSLTWIGEVINPRMIGNDVVGDLAIIDKPTAMKLAYGAKMGISPKVSGGEEGGKMVQFRFDNFSVVINPAVKTAYINNHQQGGAKMAEEEKPEEQTQEQAPAEEKPAEEKPAEEKPESTVENTKKEKSETVDQLMDALGSDELAKKDVSAIAKKAKQIRKEGESWSAAIKRAAKMMEEELAEKAQKEKYPYKYKEMKDLTDDELVSSIATLSEEMAKRKKKMPEEEEKMQKKKEEYPYPEEKKMSEKTKEMSEELHKKDQTIKELSERLSAVEQKLNEPAKASVKTAELGQQAVDPDMSFLEALKAC